MIKRLLLIFLFIFITHKIFLWAKPFGEILNSIPFSSEIVDRNGKLLRLSLAEDDTYRLPIKLDDISPLAKNATLLYEDRYFYFHPGINPLSLFRALWETFVIKKRTLGASTITMQLSRKLYKINTRSIFGKIQQILRALQLEFLYNKNEILEAYFNLAPYGFNIEGLSTASLIYFDKPASRLSLLESLTLAVIPQRPSDRTRHIYRDRKVNPNLKSVRNLLLSQWIKTYPTNVEQKLDFNLDLDMRHPRRLPFHAPHLSSRILQWPTPGRKSLTIDLNIQKTLEETLTKYILSEKKMGIQNAAALLVDTRNMESLAYIGSADFFNDKISGQVDGVKARRSPGSALKPFAYALAIEQGKIHPLTMLKDAPTPFGTYTPDNFDRAFAGPLSATEALIHSRNIPAIHIAQELESPTLHDFLLKFGIPLNPDPEFYGLSIVLGTAEVTMEELVELYALFNNHGKKKRLYHDSSHSPEDAIDFLSPETSFLTLNMLAENPKPDGGQDEKWNVNPKSIAWKTGTSVGFRDAWAIGNFDHYVIAVWVGNFSGEGNPIFVGRHAAGPLMFSMIEAFSKLEPINFQSPSPDSSLNLTEIEFCTLSGHLPNENCPHHKTGYFIPGVSPIHSCSIHRKIDVDTLTGQQVCPGFKGDKTAKVYEYWPTDLLKLYQQAGIGRKTPPTLHSSCHGEKYGDIGPFILSPKKEITYHLRLKGSDSKDIPLLAVADGNIQKLTWFINNEKLGTSPVSDSLIWKAKSGKHTARVVDELGRSSEVQFQVEWIE